MTFAAVGAYGHVDACETSEFILPRVWRRCRRCLNRDAERGAADEEIGFSIAVGEESEMSDAHEAAREDVEEEASNEFKGMESHGFSAVLVSVILPGERHRFIVHGKDAMIGDGDAVSVSAEIGDDLFGAAKGRFGVNDPIVPAEALTKCEKGGGCGERRENSWENQLAGFKCPSKEVEELAAKET